MSERQRQYMDCRECHTLGYHTGTEGCVLFQQPVNPRETAHAAYLAFMGMSDSEWTELVRSLLLEGGVLTLPEQAGFRRAYDERRAL